MAKSYHHLTYEERCQIYALLKRGISKLSIAKELGHSASTISREIKRNTGNRGYRFKQAQEKAEDRRHKANTVKSKMTSSTILLIEEKLKTEQWSPEQISGWLKDNTEISISYESIYQHIWSDKKQGGLLYQHLRRKHKKYNKRAGKLAGRGLIPDRVDIEKRPKIVEQKERIGDLEIDTIVGANHIGAIVSIVDRVSKYVWLELLTRATAENTSNALINQLKSFKKHIHTLTADNGKEFAGHKLVATSLEAEVYFAKPYHSWERGLNENTNGLVRQYFPKKCDFTSLTQEKVLQVQNKLNNRPRKSLGYKKPAEVFFGLMKLNPDCALHC
jgi:IS30 family transposase